MKYELKITEFFEAAHQLPDTECLVSKACTRLHGHTYCAKITILSKKLNEGQMVVDFKAVKEIVRSLDHQLLNDFIKVPTAENTAKYISDLIRLRLNLGSIVEIAEGYKGEGSSWVKYE